MHWKLEPCGPPPPGGLRGPLRLERLDAVDCVDGLGELRLRLGRLRGGLLMTERGLRKLCLRLHERGLCLVVTAL